MSKATVSTGGYLIDPQCKHQGGVLVQYNGDIYSCTLNQTNISSNNNKFYIIQAIQVSANNYCIFVRYGRIGDNGTCSYKDFGTQSQAISFFEKQFKTKTGNPWSNKNDFKKINGKYFMTKIELVEEEEEPSSEESEEVKCDLDVKVIDFLKLISNQTYMKNTLTQLEIDTEKMPLGKISQDQIDSAYQILNDINNNIGDDKLLIQLSSDYYTLIPINVGRKRPPIINTTVIIGKNMNLLNELSQMVYGSKSVSKIGKNNVMSNLIKIYDEINTKFYPLGKTDEMYTILADYLNNSKAPTHHFKFSIEDIFEIDRPKERKAYEEYSKDIKNKTLLFHGTRVSNLIGILKSGLVVDPSKLGINVCITGKMFGMGLYFANSCSKSINYCAYDTSDNIACIFVSEVALGKMLEKTYSDSSLSAKTLPKGYQSTWGQGASTIDKYDNYDDGTRIPSGKLNQSQYKHCSLLYDEFIVYHEEQINLRYIIKLKVKDDY